MKKDRLRRIGKSNKDYASRLLSLSSLPSREKNRWERVLPQMSGPEIEKFNGILETEISDLADVYLTVLQRKQESRVFDFKTEVGEMPTYTVKHPVSQQKEIYDVDDVESEKLQSYLKMDQGDREKEMRVLDKLVKGASFVPEDKKQAMIEVSKYMPSYVLKDLQEVIIREGLRKLKEAKKKKKNDEDDMGESFSLAEHKNVIRLRGFLSSFDEVGGKEYILETRSGNKFLLLSEHIDLDQYTDNEVKLEGFKDEHDGQLVYVNKIKIATKK